MTHLDLRYKTDFNDVDQDGRVTTLPGWDGSVLVPRLDTAVELFDGDANTCIGIVERVDQSTGLIYVKPLWDTWSDGIQSTLPSLVDSLVESVYEATKQTTRSALPLVTS